MYQLLDIKKESQRLSAPLGPSGDDFTNTKQKFNTVVPEAQ